VASSTLGTIGLATEDQAAFQALVLEADKRAQHEQIVRNVKVRRWEDESGAGVVLAWRGQERRPELVSFMPAYAALSEVRLAQAHPVREPIAVANVLDADGTHVTALAAELEQYRHLVAQGQPVDGPARISAFGLSVRVYPDEDAFRAAPEGASDETDNDATPEDDSTAFTPFGAFAEPAKAQPHARLTGTVLKAERRINRLTGQPFTVAITRTAGFEADVCLSGQEHPEIPAPGAIITGVVSLFVSLTP
jgi:hypothetical protein